MVTCPRLRWKKNRGISEGSLLEREMPLGSWLIRMRSSIHEARTAVSIAPSTNYDCAWVYRWLSKRTGGPILGYRWQTPALAAQLASMQGGHQAHAADAQAVQGNDGFRAASPAAGSREQRLATERLLPLD